MVRFTVFGEPVAQGRPRFARRGNFVTAYDPKQSRSYKSVVYGVALEVKPPEMLDGPLEVSIDAYFSLPKSAKKTSRILAEKESLYHTKKGDADNIAKSILDAVQGVLFKDDSQVARLTVTKRYTVSNPRVSVIIRQID